MSMLSKLRRIPPEHSSRSNNANYVKANIKPHNHALENIPRVTLFWLILVNSAIIIPLAGNVTIWTLVITIICILWRVGIFYGKLSRPPKYLVNILAIVTAGTIIMLGAQLGVLSSLINMLVLGYAMKIIEMRYKRDVGVIIIVGYFLIALTFLNSQSIINGFHLIIITIINTCGLVSIHQGKTRTLDTLFEGIKFILVSIPFAAILFIALPRLPPLWMVHQFNQDKTGLSDSIQLGDIEKLTRSPDLAFRASFENHAPKSEDMYWRAIVLDLYDGTTWFQNPRITALQKKAPLITKHRAPKTEETINYDIIAEPSGQHWLYGLDLAYSSSLSVSNLPDYRLYAHTKLDKKFSYKVKSDPNAVMDKSLYDYLKTINLILPKNVNPKTLELAKQIKSENPDPESRAIAILTYFKNNPFYYTLSPPAIGVNQIDDFLFSTRSGFCAHYSSAMIYLARAVGLPARMVTGYMGGEYNANGNYYSVYQYMAHAWTEIWFEDKGWVRYDPTNMVAPERILDGFDAIFDPRESYLENSPLSSLNLKSMPYLNHLRLYFASMDYYWSIWVLNFDPEKQHNLLKKILGDSSRGRVGIFMVACFSVTFLLLAWYAGLFTRKEKTAKLILKYRKLIYALGKLNLKINNSDGPLTIQQKVTNQHPQWQENITDITHAIEQIHCNPCITKECKTSLTRQTISKIDKFILSIKLFKKPNDKSFS